MTRISVASEPRGLDEPRQAVLGVSFVRGELAGAAEKVIARARGGRGGYACFCNVHVLVLAQHDAGLRSALDAAWAVFPDGAPVAWLQRRLGTAEARRIAGPDLMPRVVDRGRVHGLRHFLLGSTPAVLRRCEDVLRRAYPAARFVGAASPPFQSSPHADPALLEAIRSTTPDLVWVALGAPKQEFWMYEHAYALGPAVTLGVGAAFELIAGMRPRAPRWMQRTGLEWLHRLSVEPRRLTGRYVHTNGEFVLRAGLELARRQAR
jgi:N-acetylglucosaminyldiphosphoundecaprenol N-acetyl-beta-D-mannosaminyltransferase